MGTALTPSNGQTPPPIHFRAQVLAITDLNGVSYRIRQEAVIGIAALQIEAKRDNEIKQVPGVMLLLSSGREVAVVGRLEEWHGRVFGRIKSPLEL
jgi:hypothetical protein